MSNQTLTKKLSCINSSLENSFDIFISFLQINPLLVEAFTDFCVFPSLFFFLRFDMISIKR